MPHASPSLRCFQVLKDRILDHKRIAGTYIIDAAAVPGLGAGPERERLLREFAAGLGFSPPDVDDDEWRHAEVFREDARQRLIGTLVGGAEIGHSRWDVPPAEAEVIADQFLALFDGDSQFYCDVDASDRAQGLVPYGRPDFRDYIFGGGCVAVGEHIAAVLWVLDND